MSAINDGGPAFPTAADNGHSTNQDGMSLRDYFANTALGAMAIIPQPSVIGSGRYPLTCEDIARIAYAYADAMVKAREAA